MIIILFDQIKNKLSKSYNIYYNCGSCYRDKTDKLETLKMNILKEIEASDQEDKCLIEYRKELELLLQEKMAHVEELRQIHADINAVCINNIIF